jgi:hypothetical protein
LQWPQYDAAINVPDVVYTIGNDGRFRKVILALQQVDMGGMSTSGFSEEDTSGAR